MADTDITVLAMELIDAYESMSAARKQFLVRIEPLVSGEVSLHSILVGRY